MAIHIAEVFRWFQVLHFYLVKLYFYVLWLKNVSYWVESGYYRSYLACSRMCASIWMYENLSCNWLFSYGKLLFILMLFIISVFLPDTEGFLDLDRARSWSLGSSSVVSAVYCILYWSSFCINMIALFPFLFLRCQMVHMKSERNFIRSFQLVEWESFNNHIQLSFIWILGYQDF